MRLLCCCSVLFLVALGAACGNDSKGNSCGVLDMYVSSDDDTYCPDPDAPEQCEALFDDMLGAFVICAEESGLSYDEDDLRAELEDRGALPSCDRAVATSLGYEDCQDLLRDPECEGSTPKLGDSCSGVVLTGR